MQKEQSLQYHPQVCNPVLKSQGIHVQHGNIIVCNVYIYIMKMPLCWAEEKIKGKKDSKQKKKKKAGKEKTGPSINIQEAQERLRVRIAELQGMLLFDQSSGTISVWNHCFTAFVPLNFFYKLSMGRASCDSVVLPNLPCMLDVLMFP